ncbi:EAL and GGDEF domain-containing protein [Agrobacterium rubi]|uniref:EAL domain-containing protein n=1 Tax=Agrobacterium rubi TaxID=28099 RepID=A0AAE7UPJ6_9HYPH|nr:bifunctional diguanylate cyclase/phosphodiesterase [Agrobacterium rubi]NTE86556.1 EAL domain-containing protein [Agrobacterium rubi]NTF02488.1 EAL domain-containing protein [Agrobacterium rubi]NTF36733.1 EAL domain-containing protein [Agrobacterium rubi]OCJ55642.1 diguanylate cyclase [Agrobacterium rubi]QTF99185.1 EAL domain-containing protein [Agrobacterium rubi]
MDQDLLLKDILDSLPVPAIQIWPGGDIAYLPPNVPLPPCDKPTHLLDFIHADDHGRSIAALDALAAQSPATLEVQLSDNPSVQRYALLSLSSIRASERTVILAQFTDITAQRLREQDIAQRESRWNSALVSSLSGVWDQNFVTGEMYGSETWRAIRGMTLEDPIETDFDRWVDLIHPDDREHTLHCIERQNAGDPAYTAFQYRERHKNGHWVWIECRGACIERDEYGKAVRIVGTDTDVSERKATENEMERISRHLKVALEASQVGVFEVDFDAGETIWDNRMYEMYKVDPDTPVRIGGLWETRVHPDDLDRVHKNVWNMIQELQPFSEDYRIVMEDDSLRYIRARSLPFIDVDGRRKMIGVNWDVTSDVQLRNELERARNLAEARACELEAAKLSIEHNAMHDYLTDLPNRRYLDDLLERRTLAADKTGSGIAILHIGLDRFKQINDTLGHRAGDVMLKHVAEMLRRNLKTNEFIARIGGDEFVLLLPFNGNTRKIASTAERLVKELRKPVLYDGQECRFGASIGIACGMAPNFDYKQLLLNADMALYNAKKSGRNRYEFFSSDTQDWLINTKRVSDEILMALERDEFVPYYQFQFDTHTLDICGVETLARWNHPIDGILTPDKFLDIAEDLDVVAAIDGIILEKALIDFKRWRADGLPIPKVSVNVSARRLHDPLLTKTLDGLKMEPGTLSFELLESIFLDDSNDIAISNMQKLRALGIDIEIDDFGTGHASIISLLKVSPTTLKVDRELVRLAPQSTEQRKLLGAIIDIGHSLGIKVVAEGVETADHIRILQAMNCDSLQGYALCRPLPAGHINAFVEAEAWRTAPFTVQRSTRTMAHAMTVPK